MPGAARGMHKEGTICPALRSEAPPAAVTLDYGDLGPPERELTSAAEADHTPLRRRLSSANLHHGKNKSILVPVCFFGTAG